MNIIDLIYRHDQWGMRQNHAEYMSLFEQILINGNKISMMIGLYLANDYK